MTKRIVLTAIALISLSGFIQAQKPIHLNEAEFKEKVFNYETNTQWKFEGDKPVIVDFYADWCGPCRMVAPTLEELAKEYDGELIIYKVNTDHNPTISSVFGISGIPAFLFIPKTGMPTMASGALPKETFVRAITEIFKIEKTNKTPENKQVAKEKIETQKELSKKELRKRNRKQKKEAKK
jgi:thioredoxin